MTNIALILFCTLAGIVFKRYKLIPADAHKGINVFILYIALPAVSFKYIPQIPWNQDLLFPVCSSVLVWLGSYLFIGAYCRFKAYNRRTRSSLELSSGYSNTSFIGFPLIMAYFGEQQLGVAIICDQSMFLILSSIGIVSAIKGDKQVKEVPSAKMVMARFIRFPPVIACLSALLLSRFLDFQPVEPFFDKLTATVGPLALFSLGLQLNIKGWRPKIAQISVALLYKLILAPTLVLCAAFLLGIKGDTARISIFEAGMPTLITASIIAEQFNLNSKLVNLIIGVGILAGFISTGIWSIIINSLFPL